MAKEKRSNLTVNWQKNKGKRGLTEKCYEMLLEYGTVWQKEQLLKNAQNLWDEYTKMRNQSEQQGLRATKAFSLEKEIEMCNRYIEVRV